MGHIFECHIIADFAITAKVRHIKLPPSTKLCPFFGAYCT